MLVTKRWLYSSALLINDICVLYLSFWLAYWIRFNCEPFLEILPALKGVPPWEMYQTALRSVMPLLVVVFAMWGRLYGVHFRDAADEFLTILKCLALSMLLVVSITFLYRRHEYSRLYVMVAFVVSAGAVFISRQIVTLLLSKIIGSFARSELVLIIGEGKSIHTMAKHIKKNPHKRVFSFTQHQIKKVRRLIGHNRRPPQEIYLSGKLLRDEGSREILDLLDECEDREIKVKIVPDILEMRLGEVIVDDTLGLPVFYLRALSLHGFRYAVKRTFDITICLSILTVLFIPFCLISLFIILESKGGIFFYQERVGFKEKRFRCLKFRTMHANAEKLLEEMKLQSFRGGPAFKMKDDPRITRVGKWLRKFSFDEFPQIWNILRGEMSLIGPRPQVLAEAKGNPDWARRRYRALPGITGLWQVSGRADLPYLEMMRLDIYYLENWSPGMDLKILLKTVPVVLGGHGAY